MNKENEQSTEEIIDKVDSFLDKKGLDISSKFAISKKMQEQYWDEWSGDEEVEDESDDLDIEEENDTPTVEEEPTEEEIIDLDEPPVPPKSMTAKNKKSKLRIKR